MSNEVEVPLEHYIKMIKEHEEKALSWNERQKYWEEYKRLMFWKNRQ
mgnify:FL=1|jgi:hypothetical protein